MAFVRPGVADVLTVMAVELAIISNMRLYSPELATYRLEHSSKHLVARSLAAWSIGPAGSHRHPHRTRRAAHRHHQPTHCTHGRRTAHFDHTTPASPTGPAVAAQDGTVPQPLVTHHNSPSSERSRPLDEAAPIGRNARVSTVHVFDPTPTALLVMDYQTAVLAFALEREDRSIICLRRLRTSF